MISVVVPQISEVIRASCQVDAKIIQGVPRLGVLVSFAHSGTVFHGAEVFDINIINRMQDANNCDNKIGDEVPKY